MIIVTGRLYVDAAVRGTYLADCREIVESARAQAGCLDFHLSADPLEEDRINVYEAWESVGALTAFRGSGPSGPQAAQIKRADVRQYEVVSATKL